MNNEITSKVAYISPAQSTRAIMLCVLAQSFMPAKKRFGAILWGQSGIGKNAMTDDLPEKLNAMSSVKDWSMLDEELASASPEEIRGLPVIPTSGQSAKFMPFRTFLEGSRGILRVDEIDRPAYMQSLIALVKVAIDRTGENSVPLNWFFLGMGNGVSDQHTQELTEHIRGRVCHLYLSTNSDAAQDGIKEYYKSRNLPACLQSLAEVSPISTRDEFDDLAVDNNRTREFAGCIIAAYDKFNGVMDFSDVLFPCLAGVIGMTTATELFRLKQLEKLPTLDEVIDNPTGAILVDDLSLRHKHVTSLIEKAGNDCSKQKKLVNYILRGANEQTRYFMDMVLLHCQEISKYAPYVAWMNRATG